MAIFEILIPKAVLDKRQDLTAPESENQQPVGTARKLKFPDEIKKREREREGDKKSRISITFLLRASRLARIKPGCIIEALLAAHGEVATHGGRKREREREHPLLSEREH